MLKTLAGFVTGLVVTGILTWGFGGDLMFREVPSPFGVEETAARIQRNIQALEHKGWKLSGLRSPSRSIEAAGGNVPPTLLIEACSTDYSGPILKQEHTRVLSILMPCTITVYKKDDGKTYIGLMNAALMGKLFGPLVSEIMQKVSEDQTTFITFDPQEPAPKLIIKRPGGGGSGSGTDVGGC